MEIEQISTMVSHSKNYEKSLVESLDLSARGLYLLKAGLWTDVEFEVGENKDVIKAHRLVLASASPVFETLLYGPSAENISPISVPDVTPEFFKLMLQYVYSDKVESTTIEQLPEFENISRKYLMPRLMEAFRIGLIKTLNPENAVIYYELAAASKCEPLIDKCTKVFQYQTQRVLASKSFLQAKLETVEFIFSLEGLAIVSEYELVTALKEYTESNGIMKKIENDQMHPSLRQILLKIRFLNLEPEELAGNCLQIREFLSDFDLMCLMAIKLHREAAVPIPFTYTSRRTLLDVPFLLPVTAINEIKIGRVFKIRGIPVNPETAPFIENFTFEIYFKSHGDLSVCNGTIFLIRAGDSQDGGPFVHRNTCDRSWGEDEKEGVMPFERGKPFEITIVIESERFEVFVNGRFFCYYVHRMPYTEITHFGMSGDLNTLEEVYF